MAVNLRDLQKAATDKNIYATVRDAAARAGVEQGIRAICMLLDAPPGLIAFRLMAERIHEMLKVLPAVGEDVDRFAGWAEAADWFLQLTTKFNPMTEANLSYLPERAASGRTRVHEHPMRLIGLERYPLYSAMFNQTEGQKRAFLQLKAQVLIARYDELMKLDGNLDSWLQRYEEFPKDIDFARSHKVRATHSVGRALRNLSRKRIEPVLAYVPSNEGPEIFVQQLWTLLHDQKAASKQLIDDDARGYLFNARPYLEVVQTYCSRLSAAQLGKTRTPTTSYGGGSSIEGYVLYNSGRLGIVRSHIDPEDGEAEEGHREQISDFDSSARKSPSDEFELGEGAAGLTLLLQSDAKGNGIPPGKQASSRTLVSALEIEPAFLPWSLVHLRPLEVQRLVQQMASTLKKDVRISEDEKELLALTAVCMDTGRAVKEAVQLKVGADGSVGELFYLPERGERKAQWQWPAIGPNYTTKRKPEDDEVERVDRLCFPVPPLVEALIEERLRGRNRVDETVFPGDPLEYERRIKRKIIGVGSRWTLHKLSRLKWSLLVQVSGGDLAAASLVLGKHHRLACVPLFYSLLSVDRATELYQQATDALWGGAPRLDLLSEEERRFG